MPEFQFYGNFFEALANKEVDLNDGNVKVALVQSGYTPNYDTHDYFNDITNEAPATGGYTAGGQALTTPVFAYVPSASATAHATSTAYQLGDIVRPSVDNSHVYLCVAAGTSGGSAPTWSTTRGASITDGTVTWVEAGRGYFYYDADNPQWAASTITARYAVYYYNTGTGTTSALIGALNFGTDQSSSSGNFTITHDATGIFVIPVR